MYLLNWKFWVLGAFLCVLLLSGCGGDVENLRAQLAADTRDKSTPNYAFTVKKTTFPEGFELAYVDEGEGLPIVFVHGLGGYLKHWEPTLKLLHADFRCIALDLPGYGYSQRAFHQPQDLMRFYAETILHLADHLQLETFVLAGHSMGGQVAMVTALQAPARVKALVLAAPAGFEIFSTIEAAGLKQFANADFFAGQDEEMIRASFALNFHQMPAAAETLIAERMAMRSNYGFEAYCYTVAQGVKGMLDHPVASQLPDISQPTLVLFGENDRLIPNTLLHQDLTTAEVAEQGAQRMPAATLQILPQTGHLLTFERPEQVAQAMVQFLKTLSDNTEN